MKMRDAYRILATKLQGKIPLWDADISGRILKLILDEQDLKLWTGMNYLRTGFNGGIFVNMMVDGRLLGCSTV
jgi:hypothetical protein